MSDWLQKAAKAYKRHEYAAVIELLSHVEDVKEEESWYATMYLGMSYVKANNAAETNPLLKQMSTSCSNPHLKNAAAALLTRSQSTERPS